MESKQRILLSALRIFLKKGYKATSIKEIMDESQFTKGAIYHHFSSKEELFLETIDLLFDTFAEWEAELYKDQNSLQEILLRYFQSLGEIRLFLQNLAGDNTVDEFNFYLLMMEAFINFPEIREKHRETHQKNNNRFITLLRAAQQEGVIRNEIECETLALMINALGEGTLMYHILNEPIDLQQIGEKIFTNIWNGIAVRKE